MRKALLATVSSDEFSTITLNSKLSKVVSYIQDKKAWYRIYVLLKILFPCLRTLRLADRKKSGMDKVFYYSRMTKISIIKSSNDIDNKELFTISSSSSQKVWRSSDSDTEDEEENIDTDDPDTSDSDMLESLSSSVCNLWQKIQLHINTDFAVTGWMICVIPHIHKYAKDHSDRNHRKQVNNVIKKLFSGSSEDEMNVTLDVFWTEYTAFDNKVGSYAVYSVQNTSRVTFISYSDDPENNVLITLFNCFL